MKTGRYIKSQGLIMLALVLTLSLFFVIFVFAETFTVDTSRNIVNSSYLTYDYENVNRFYSVYFQDNFNTGEAVRFEKGDYYVSYDLSGGKIQWFEQEGDSTKTKSIGAILTSTPTINANIITYPTAFADTDVQYTLQQNGIKEIFILNSYPAVDGTAYLYLEYTGDLRFSNELTIYANGQNQSGQEFQTIGAIELKDLNGITVFTLPAPTVEDSDGDFGTAYYNVKPGSGKLTFGLRVNKTWMDTANFPIYVDPTFTVDYSPIPAMLLWYGEVNSLNDSVFPNMTDISAGVSDNNDSTQYEVRSGTGGSSEFDNVIYSFDLDETSAPIDDASNNDLDTVIGGDSNLSVTGRDNSGVYFDGVNDYIQINQSSAMNVSAGGDFIVCMAMNTSTVSGGVMYDADYNVNDELTIELLSNGKVKATLARGGANVNVQSIFERNDGVWHNVCVLHDVSEDVLTLFVNALSVSNATITDSTALTIGSDIYIGNSLALNADYEGKLDELCMWAGNDLDLLSIKDDYVADGCPTSAALNTSMGIAMTGKWNQTYDSEYDWFLRVKKTTAGTDDLTVVGYQTDDEPDTAQNNTKTLIGTGWFNVNVSSILDHEYTIEGLNFSMLRFWTTNSANFSEMLLRKEVNDTTFPVITDAAINDTTISCLESSQFSANVTDNLDVDTVTFTIEGVTYNATRNGDIFSYNLFPTVNGTIVYDWNNITATDIVGNVNTTEPGTTVTYTCVYEDYINIQSVQANNITNQTANITWTTANISDSLVEYGTNSSNLSESSYVATLTTDHLVSLTGLLNNTLYYYQITSANGAITQTSIIYNFTTLANVVADTTPPGDITDLLNISQDNQSIFVNWTNPIDSDYNHSELYTNTTGGGLIFVSNVTSPTTEYNITGLTNNTIYTIQIRPVDHLDNLGNYSTVTTTTYANPDLVAPNVTSVTSSPTLPIINTGGEENLTINFTSDEYPITHLFILYNSTGSQVDTQGPIVLNSSSDLPLVYTIPNTLDDGLFELNFTVNDTNDNSVEYSVGSFTVDATAPGDITNLLNISQNNQSIFVNWTIPVDSDFNHTEVWYNETAGSLTFFSNISQPSNSENITGLTPNTIYTIQARPVDHYGNLGNFATVTTTTLANPDQIAPVITNITSSPTLPLNNTGDEQNLTLNFTSDEYPIDIYFILYNSTFGIADTQGPTTLNSAGDLPITYTIPDTLVDGTYELNFTVNDTSDNSNEYSTGSFTVEATGPVIVNCQANVTTLTCTEQAELSCNVTDGSGVNSVTFTLNNINYTASQSGDIWSYTLFPDVNDTITYDWNSTTAIDSLANQASINPGVEINYSCVYEDYINITHTGNETTTDWFNLTSEEIVIYWSTDNPTNSSVNYGTELYSQATVEVSEDFSDCSEWYDITGSCGACSQGDYFSACDDSTYVTGTNSYYVEYTEFPITYSYDYYNGDDDGANLVIVETNGTFTFEYFFMSVQASQDRIYFLEGTGEAGLTCDYVPNFVIGQTYNLEFIMLSNWTMDAYVNDVYLCSYSFNNASANRIVQTHYVTLVSNSQNDSIDNLQITYGETSARQNITSSELSTDHYISLTGLTPNTSYYYEITSAFNPSQTLTGFNFSTPPITGEIVVTANLYDATIDSTTNINANSSIYYDENQTYLLSDLDTVKAKTHSQFLGNLTDNTTYYVNQTFCTNSGNCESQLYNFTTGSFTPSDNPVVTSISPADDALLSGTISFTFNTSSAYNMSYCELYIKGTFVANNTGVVTGIVDSFSQGFSPDDDYTWYVRCVDINGLIGTSETRDFTVSPEAPPGGGGGADGGDFHGGTDPEDNQEIPIEGEKEAEVTDTVQERILEIRETVLDTVGDTGGRIEGIWEKIPVLGAVDFKQCLLAFLILFLVWRFVYKTPVKRRIT